MVLSAATLGGRFRDAVGTGECTEWQRELTVNQPSYDFAGSSPASPTSLRSLRELRLGKPARSEGCRVEARRAKTGRRAMKYVYILESLEAEHFYVGITDDLRVRLADRR